MAKFKIFDGVAFDRLRTMVPPEYRPRIPDTLSSGGPYTLLLFAHARGDVVISGPVRKALERVAQASLPIVAVGAVFTAEALAALRAHDATVISIGDFYWTDESYLSIRTMIASRR